MSTTLVFITANWGPPIRGLESEHLGTVVSDIHDMLSIDTHGANQYTSQLQESRVLEFTDKSMTIIFTRIYKVIYILVCNV